MDNYRAWFKAKTDTFKASYCSTVDNYFDLVLRQIEAFTSRTGDESPQGLSQMIKHMEDTNTLYQQQLDLLSRRYFAGKATFSPVSSAAHESTSVTNPITRDSYQVNDLAEYSANQPQQGNISKGSDANVDRLTSIEVKKSQARQQPVQRVSTTVNPKPAQSQPALSFASRPKKTVTLSVYHTVPPSSPPKASPDSLKRTLPFSGSDSNSIVAKRARGCSHTCFTCGGTFGRKTDLNRHQLTHNRERAFPCDQCDRVFTRKDHLTNHLHTRSRTMNARCTWPGCTFQAITSSIVVSHIRGLPFKLPRSQTEQIRLGIVDDRDARGYLEKM